MDPLSPATTKRVTFSIGAMRERVRDYASLLETACGDNLVGVLAYGGVVANDFFPATSDANVVLLLKQADAASLRAIATTVENARRFQHIATLILTEDEVKTSADVFPVRIKDLCERRRLIVGRDPFAGLVVSDENLRLRIEQELKELLFELRNFFLEHHSSPVDLTAKMTSTVSGFLVTVRALLHLKKVQVGPTRRDVVHAARAPLGVDEVALHEVLDLKEGRIFPDPDDLERMFARYLDTVATAARVADRLGR